MARAQRSILVVLLLATSLLVSAGCATSGGGCHSSNCCDTGCAPGAPCCWGGIYPTVLTPWNCGGCGVDVAALAAEIQYQLHGGVTGLLVLGTLGEGEYATMEEREQVITTAVTVAGGCCVPVIVGIHACDCNVALEQLRQAK